MAGPMPGVDSIDESRPTPGGMRPTVLLVMDDEDVRARFAYELAASGFDVVVFADGAGPRHSASRFDVVVAALPALRPSEDSSAGILAKDLGRQGIPLIAVARDANDATRDLARREGFAAICVTTCSGAALAAGIRDVLLRQRTLSRR